MQNNNRYLQERNDALDTLKLMDGVMEIDMNSTPTIHFPHFSSENLSLAKATFDILEEMEEEVLIIVEQFWTFLLLTSGWLRLVKVKGEPIFSFEDWEDILGANIRWFEKYTDNKFLAGMILRGSGIQVPREMTIRQSRFYPVRNALMLGGKTSEVQALSQRIHERVFKQVLTFLDKHQLTKFVAKPHDGKQGNWVVIHHTETFKQKWPGRDMFEPSDSSDILLIQEMIEPYPLMNANSHAEIEKRIDEWLPIPPLFSDWNMRVLVTYDVSSWKYITAGIVCRVDEADKPVNISISASYDSFDSIMGKCWLNREKEELRKRIEDIAIKSTNAIVQYCDNKSKHPAGVPDYQVLVGVDIILDKNKNPVVIEINDMNSGCNYELMRLEWVKALYPIARAIIGKARLNQFVQMIQSKVLQAHWAQWLEDILSGKAILQIEEEI
jgi:hypothetical protein